MREISDVVDDVNRPLYNGEKLGFNWNDIETNLKDINGDKINIGDFIEEDKEIYLVIKYNYNIKALSVSTHSRTIGKLLHISNEGIHCNQGLKKIEPENCLINILNLIKGLSE